MKRLLRSFLIHTAAIWLVSQQLGGLSYNDDLLILAVGGASLTLVDAFIKPLLNILLLPFNLITLGTFRWIVNVFTLYLATLLVRGFSVVSFTYLGANLGGFVVPQMEFGLILAYVAVAFFISVVSSILFWLVH